MAKKRMQAVYDTELEVYLTSIGEWHRIAAREAKCKYCGTTITIDNLNMMFPESGDVKYVCDNPECILQYGQRREE